LAPAGAKADELCRWCVQVKRREVGQAAAGGLVAPTPPVARSISSNETGPTSIEVSGSVTSPVSRDSAAALGTRVPGSSFVTTVLGELRQLEYDLEVAHRVSLDD